MNEQAEECVRLKNRIRDAEYEIESNRALQKKISTEFVMKIDQFKQQRSQN